MNRHQNQDKVSVPYEITLLSNFCNVSSRHLSVSVPYEITLLSNLCKHSSETVKVSVPYEITLLSNTTDYFDFTTEFQYLMKLHYSQTKFLICPMTV